MVARQSHKLQVAGSNPVPATTTIPTYTNAAELTAAGYLTLREYAAAAPNASTGGTGISRVRAQQLLHDSPDAISAIVAGRLQRVIKASDVDKIERRPLGYPPGVSRESLRGKKKPA